MIAKTQEEIDILREGGKRHARILKELAALVAPGVSTQTLEDRARALVNAGGDTASFLNYKPYGAKRPYPAALCVSINDVIVHGIPNETPVTLREGDIVKLDLGITHEGLITDAAVCVIAGKPRSSEESELVAATYEALDAAIGAARCGGRVGDISGHGVGRQVHEEPYVPNYGTPGTGAELVPGLVIAIEPMFTLGTGATVLDKDGYSYRTKDGSRSAHAEHTIIITKNGAEILTQE
jgi:methionyl aminopeptidase